MREALIPGTVYVNSKDEFFTLYSVSLNPSKLDDPKLIEVNLRDAAGYFHKWTIDRFFETIVYDETADWGGGRLTGPRFRRVDEEAKSQSVAQFLRYAAALRGTRNDHVGAGKLLAAAELLTT